MRQGSYYLHNTLGAILVRTFYCMLLLAFNVTYYYYYYYYYFPALPVLRDV